ncbi:hypothetical protein [Candidatus Tisiphia endosymbiont of Oplodontha viridula]|uniref:hypothetical protein n=1 Tax=Candidatus Tisiphia endosymbiont of Oplodontha viridula TaxID=3077925 RepID=UPI0035C91E3F
MFKKLTNSIIVVLWIGLASVYAKDAPIVNADEVDISIEIPMSPVKFPLFKEDKKDIDALIKKLDSKRKREIVFSISSDKSQLKRWQPYLTETNHSDVHTPSVPYIPKLPCINPIDNYNQNSIVILEDNEYFYIKKHATGSVRRYKKPLR